MNVCPIKALARTQAFYAHGSYFYSLWFFIFLDLTYHLTKHLFKILHAVLYRCLSCMIFFFSPPCSTWSSRARDQILATVVTYATAAAMPNSLIHCASSGIKLASWRFRDAANPVVPQRELPSCFSYMVWFVINFYFF